MRPAEVALTDSKSGVAIACGGTGGHLFPGVAVGRELLAAGRSVLLIVSEKEIDRQALEGEKGFEVMALPTVGVQGWTAGWRFLWGTVRSRAVCRKRFRAAGIGSVLSMGGFTSAGPILAGRSLGTSIYLHDSNAIPGKANRVFSRWADAAFVGFEEAAVHLRCRTVIRTGTPVRSSFYPRPPRQVIRERWGFSLQDPLVLVMGGSQGARGVNQAFLSALPKVLEKIPRLQVIHLAGKTDVDDVEKGYRSLHSLSRWVVKPFAHEMAEILAGSDLVVSRSGASSLAEFAACGLPAILVPYPHAADDHQTANAMALLKTGAAWLCRQSEAGEGLMARLLMEALLDGGLRERAAKSMAAWDCPGAARAMVEKMSGRR